MRLCANCGGARVSWTAAALMLDGVPVRYCADCNGLDFVDRPSDGELLEQMRDSLREIERTLTLLAERIP